jgi:hypothetical protein
MSQALAGWIRAHGTRLAIFPSQVYRTVQLWQVPSSRYDPVADVTSVPGGVFVNTEGSACGGYTVTGPLYDTYQALGGKAMLGDPLSQPTRAKAQLFDGAVLATSGTGGTGGTSGTGGRDARALPIVATLAGRAPAAYRRAELPPVIPFVDAAQRPDWLTDPAIDQAYLDGKPLSQASYAAAVRRYGEPLGPPAATRTGEAQAFADVVLEAPRNGGPVHAAPVTRVALAAGVVSVPAKDLVPRRPPPLPNPFALGPPQPTSAAPFAITLAVALILYGVAVVRVVRGRRRPVATVPGPRQAPHDQPMTPVGGAP